MNEYTWNNYLWKSMMNRHWYKIHGIIARALSDFKSDVVVLNFTSVYVESGSDLSINMNDDFMGNGMVGNYNEVSNDENDK
jgi:hypothetical protein